MKPVSRKERTAYYNGPKVSVASVDGESSGSDDAYNEDSGISFVADEKPREMNDEDIKIKALKQAIDIAKLMSGVRTEDVIEIAAKVATYIKKK